MDDRPTRDPIREAHRQWVAHGWTDAADAMALVTSVTRAHQLLAEQAAPSAPVPQPRSTTTPPDGRAETARRTSSSLRARGTKTPAAVSTRTPANDTVRDLTQLLGRLRTGAGDQVDGT